MTHNRERALLFIGAARKHCVKFIDPPLAFFKVTQRVGITLHARFDHRPDRFELRPVLFNHGGIERVLV